MVHTSPNLQIDSNDQSSRDQARDSTLEIARSSAQRITRAIKTISFEGIYLAPVVEAGVFLYFLSNDPKVPPSKLSRLKVHPIGVLARRLWHIVQPSRLSPIDTTDVLFDVYSNIERTVIPILGLADSFGGKTLVRVPTSTVWNRTTDQRIIKDSEIGIASWAWIRGVLRELLEWRNIVRTGLRDAGIAQEHFHFIVSQLILAALQVARMEALWLTVCPKALVVAADHHMDGAILCAIARQKDCPSITLQHGLLDKETLYLTVPVIADHYFAWGEYDAKLVTRHDGSGTQVHVVGTPLLDSSTKKTRDVLIGPRETLSLPESGSAAVLALNSASSAAEVREVVQLFQESIQALPDWFGLVRPHPANTKSEIEAYIGDMEHLIVLENGTLTAREVIDLSDAVVTQQTTFGLEVIFYGGNLVGLDIPRGSLGYVEDLATYYGAAYKAETSSDLCKCLESIRRGDDSYKGIRACVKTALQEFIAESGEASNHAAARALKAILNT